MSTIGRCIAIVSSGIGAYRCACSVLNFPTIKYACSARESNMQIKLVENARGMLIPDNTPLHVATSTVYPALASLSRRKTVRLFHRLVFPLFPIFHPFSASSVAAVAALEDSEWHTVHATRSLCWRRMRKSGAYYSTERFVTVQGTLKDFHRGSLCYHAHSSTSTNRKKLFLKFLHARLRFHFEKQCNCIFFPCIAINSRR